MRSPDTIPLQSAALLGAVVLCAVVANAVAGARRHLAWTAAPITAVVPAPIPEAPPPPPTPDPAALSVPIPKAMIQKSNSEKPARPEPPRPSQPVREISSAEAWEAYQSGAAFLDARRSAEFEAGHVEGAWSLPVWESTLDERLVEFEAKANRPPEAPLVLYCSGGTCEDSHLLAGRLFQLGYRNLLIYRDGYPDWLSQGRPVASEVRK